MFFYISCGLGAALIHILSNYYFFHQGLNELIEASAGQDEQLIEAYGHLSKVELKKIITFYQEIVGACEMLGQEAKVNRKPRTKVSIALVVQKAEEK